VNELEIVGISISSEAIGQRSDSFYSRLLELSKAVNARILPVEVADMNQAIRVAAMARDRKRWQGIEIWRDEPYLHQPHVDLVGMVRVVTMTLQPTLSFYTYWPSELLEQDRFPL